MKFLQPPLIFPETEPVFSETASLLTLFDSLLYYLPTEPQKPHDNEPGTTGHCTGYAPAPLGEDLGRFNRLLREMETGRPDEFSRLFAAAAAPVATGQVKDRDETSASGVLAALQRDTEAKAELQRKERLWQARLVLKLAEMLDSKENEVRQGLDRISSVERNVFASLDGQSEKGPADSAVQTGLKVQPRDISQGTSALLLPLRVKAWAELFLADQSLIRPSILLSLMPDSGAILLEDYENGWHRQPLELFSLAIPAFDCSTGSDAVSDDYLSRRDSFRSAVNDSLEYFAGFLAAASRTHDSTVVQQVMPAPLAGHVSAWEKQLAQDFPAQEKPCKKVTLYCLPNVSITELLKNHLGLKTAAPHNSRDSASGIIAVVNP